MLTERVAATPTETKQISISNEYLRKLLHLCSLSIPVAYYYISRDVALALLVPLTLFSIAVDIGRHYMPWLAKLVAKIFDPILREHERGKLLSGATYVFISALLCVFIFPKLLTITAFAILIVSDAASAIIGRHYGKHPFFDKSLEGSIAFVLSALIVVFTAPKALGLPIEYAIATLGAIVGAIFEAASVRLKTDDNLSVPTSIGLTMWLCYIGLSRLDPQTYRPLYEAMLAFK